MPVPPPNINPIPLYDQAEWEQAVRDLLGIEHFQPPTDGIQAVPESPAQATAGIQVVPKDQKKEENRLWIKKAAQRRLKKNRPKEETPAPDYAPQFSPPRVKDPSPVFEQTEEALEGHPVSLRGPDARRRETSFIFVGCMVTALLATSAAAIMLHGKASDAQASPAVETARAEAAEISQMQRVAARVPEAVSVLKAFLRMDSPEDKVQLVRGGVAMLPAMRSYYASHPDEPDGFKSATNIGLAEHAGREFLMIRGVSYTGKNIETLVEVSPAGLKLDWRFLTGAGEMEWTDWIKSHPPQEMTMRAEAVLDDYYAGPFSDAKEWLCLKMTDATRSSTVWAYTARTGPEGITLLRQLRERKGPVRLTGTFSFPDPLPAGHHSTPQVRLCSVATQGWLDQSPAVNDFNSPPSFSPPITTAKPQ